MPRSHLAQLQLQECTLFLRPIVLPSLSSKIDSLFQAKFKISIQMIVKRER